MKRAHQVVYDTETYYLSKAVSIVQRDILEQEYSFDGTFPKDCQNKSILVSLRTLVNMILKGQSIDQHSAERVPSQTSLTISQLIVFNNIISGTSSSPTVCHAKMHRQF